MKKVTYLFAPLLIASLFLTGCISKQPQPVAIDGEALTEENSTLEESPNRRFTLRVPNDFTFFLDQEQETASLYRIIDPQTNETRMFFEENLTSIDQAASLLVNLDEITEVSRETIELNGLQGLKITVELSTAPGLLVPYYILQGGEYAYVFSLVAGAPFEWYLPIINSFDSKLTN